MGWRSGAAGRLPAPAASSSSAVPSKQRRISRWEPAHVPEAVQRRLDETPQAMRQRREAVEHPFGTLKARMGAARLVMKRLRNLRAEMAARWRWDGAGMALSVLASTLARGA